MLEIYRGEVSSSLLAKGAEPMLPGDFLEADVGRVRTVNSQQSKPICRQCLSRDSLHTGAILGNADFWQSRQPSLIGAGDGSPQGP